MKKAFFYILGLVLLGARIVDSADTSFAGIKEAEDFVRVNGVVESKHPGFTDKGYVNFFNQAGSAAEWTISVPEAGTYGIIFRYANGSRAARDMELRVNSTIISPNLSFPPTGAWDHWGRNR